MKVTVLALGEKKELVCFFWSLKLKLGLILALLLFGRSFCSRLLVMFRKQVRNILLFLLLPCCHRTLILLFQHRISKVFQIGRVQRNVHFFCLLALDKVDCFFPFLLLRTLFPNNVCMGRAKCSRSNSCFLLL